MTQQPHVWLRASAARLRSGLELEQVLEAGVGQAVEQMVAERAALMEALPSLEDWAPRQVLVGGSSAPVSSTPGRLRSALDAGMAQVNPLSLNLLRIVLAHAWQLQCIVVANANA